MKVISSDIIVNRAGKQYGPYTVNQIIELLRNGTFASNDFAWSDSINAWVSIAEILPKSGIKPFNNFQNRILNTKTNQPSVVRQKTIERSNTKRLLKIKN